MADRVAALEVGQVRIGERVENLEERFDSHENKQNGSLDKLDHRLAAIERQLNARPSWPVSITLTMLSSLCVGLLTYLAATPR